MITLLYIICFIIFNSVACEPDKLLLKDGFYSPEVHSGLYNQEVKVLSNKNIQVIYAGNPTYKPYKSVFTCYGNTCICGKSCGVFNGAYLTVKNQTSYEYISTMFPPDLFTLSKFLKNGLYIPKSHLYFNQKITVLNNSAVRVKYLGTPSHIFTCLGLQCICSSTDCCHIGSCNSTLTRTTETSYEFYDAITGAKIEFCIQH